MVQGVRQMSHDLHPASLRLVGLAGALKAHCLEVEKRHDVQVWFDVASDLGAVPPDVALCLFRIAQEALRNGAVHGEARRLDVSLVRLDGDVELTITDNGRGFDLDVVRASGKGLGLVSMEERAHMVGGCVEITTGIDRGTTVYVRVPAVVDPTEQGKHDVGGQQLRPAATLAAEQL
jgi:two-component system sensor histidine kinase UhpB